MTCSRHEKRAKLSGRAGGRVVSLASAAPAASTVPSPSVQAGWEWEGRLVLGVVGWGLAL